MKYTAEEVRAHARMLRECRINAETTRDRQQDKLADICDAYADLLERIKANEGANDRIDFQGMWNAMSDRAYAHPPAQPRAVPDAKVMASRFMGWRLPDDFRPDGGISFDPDSLKAWPGLWPTGTNLLHIGQAEQMFRYVLAAAPSQGESNNKPTDCSGDPSSCPDNEGHGCYCSDIRRAGESA